MQAYRTDAGSWLRPGWFLSPWARYRAMPSHRTDGLARRLGLCSTKPAHRVVLVGWRPRGCQAEPKLHAEVVGVAAKLPDNRMYRHRRAHPQREVTND